jgi:hypothetical protein
MPPSLIVDVDHPPQAPLVISITSSHPAIIPPPSVTLFPPSTSAVRALTVIPQASGFVSTLVTLTASYAGRTRTSKVNVLSPDEGLPALEIDVDRSSDPCQPLFIAGASQTFRINNLFVFADQTGLSYVWSVTGAVPDATNQAGMTIAKLPATGTKVTVKVTVTNAQGLKAKGAFSFKTLTLDWKMLDRELRCRLSRFRNVAIAIPEWTSIDNPGTREKQLKALKEEVLAASKAVASVKSVIQRMNQHG